MKNLTTDEKISTVVQFIADRWRLADKTILRNTFSLLAEGSPVTGDCTLHKVNWQCC